MQAFWERARTIPKFTGLGDIRPPEGTQPFALDECQMMYMGAGWFIGWVKRAYRMDGHAQVEYGDEGLYAFSVLYFSDPLDACTHLILPVGKYDFGKMISEPAVEVMDQIPIGTTFTSVSGLLRAKSPGLTYYREGESRKLKDGRFVVSNLFIHVDRYELFFFGRGKGSKLTGFSFVLPDKI